MSKRIPLVAAAVAATVLLASGTDAWAQVQSSAQQKCLNALNKDGVAVARTQGKNNVACLKAAGKGTLVGTAQACLTSSPKVTKAQSKTTADDAKLCGTAPSFGYTDAATVNTAAAQGEVDLVADVFGAPLDAAVLSCGSNKAGCACQQKVQKGVEQLAAVKLSEFLKCKKAALKAGASSATALRNCVNDVGTIGSIAADTKGKIQKTITKLKAIIAKSCDTPGVTPAAFPNGTCSGLMNGPLGDCLDVRVECRVCQMINEKSGRDLR